MPSSGATTLIAFGAVVTAANATAGAIIAGIGVAWEAAVFYWLGRE